jgi:hypothetical protein
MVMHDRSLIRAIGDPEDTSSVILELDGVVAGVGGYGIRVAGLFRTATRHDTQNNDDR